MSSLRILTYNVSWEGYEGKLSRTADGTRCIQNGINRCTKNVVDLITESDAQLILLQEASIDVKLLPSRYQHVLHRSGQETMLTLYDPKFTGKVYKVIPGEFQPGYPYLITVFDGLIIINIHRPHASNPTLDTQTLEDAMRPYFPRLLQSRSVIIGGDFNFELKTSPQFFKKQLDAGLEIQKQKTCCSWSYGTAEKTYMYLYDYIAIDERLTFEYLGLPIKADKNVQYSDHLPVFAIVSLSMTTYDDSIRYGILKEGSVLYRGVDKECNTVKNSVRPGRPEWFSQFKPISEIYMPNDDTGSKGCFFVLNTTRPLKLIEIWNSVTMPVIIRMYLDGLKNKTVTQQEYDAFRVFTGYGIDKHPTATVPSPVRKLAFDNRFVTLEGYKFMAQRPTVSSITQDHVASIKQISRGVIEVYGLQWGPGEQQFERTSSFAADTIVMDTLRRFFPGYDGVYAAPVPSTYHTGTFGEEYILFPDVLSKVREYARVGGKRRRGTRRLRRLANVVTTHRATYAHRKPLRKTR
jgi:exonuclease III